MTNRLQVNSLIFDQCKHQCVENMNVGKEKDDFRDVCCDCEEIVENEQFEDNTNN